MRIDQKLALFSEDKLTADHLVRTAGLPGIGVTGERYLNRVLFEENIRAKSGIIRKNLPIFFGSGSYMNENGYIRGHVFIGRFCSIGRRVTIGAGHHHMTGLSTCLQLSRGAGGRYTPQEASMLGISEGDRRSLLVEIGCDVWIGDGVVVMPGVRIGHGAVIGANAVVTRDVPPYAIVAGVPAKTLRYRFPPQVIEALLQSRWWDYPAAQLQTLPMRNVLSSLESLQEWPDPKEDYQTFALQSAAST